MIGSFNAQSLSFLLQYNIGEVTNINILEEKMFSGRGRILSQPLTCVLINFRLFWVLMQP